MTWDPLLEAASATTETLLLATSGWLEINFKRTCHLRLTIRLEP